MIGREKEEKQLKKLYNSKNAQFVAIYGRRRVGKTFLVNKAFKGKITFSHAGLSVEFIDAQLPEMMDDIDCMIEEINSYGVGELWEVNSPIWVRPQDGNLAKGMYDEGLFQVVGHTPVEKALLLDNVLTLDTFSTTPSGIEIGDNEFYWVDTVTQEWGMVS